MNEQAFLRQIFLYLFWGLLFANATPSYGVALTNFSVDPASPTIDGNITADDVLNPGPAVTIQGNNLGLGFFDNLNALSYGQDFIGGSLAFSVDRLSLGLAGTAVNSQALIGEAAGDVYISLPPVGSNQLLINEQNLGLTAGFFGDDLDALSLNNKPNNSFTYFSFDFFSASNGVAANSSDILFSSANNSFSIFADGIWDIGLDSTDDIDALVLLDVINPGVLDPGIDQALFSLSSFSSSLFTRGFSSADILFTDFSGNFSLFASASELGLDIFDELDALDSIGPTGSTPVPEPITILGTTTALGFGAFFRAKRNQKTEEKD